MKSNYKKLESNSGVLKSNYKTLEFDFSNALLANGYTKHYFTEGNRVCSKIGGGFANAPANPLATQVAPMEMAYNEQKSFQEDGIMRTFVECIDKEVAFNFFNKISNSVQNSLNLNDPEPAFYYLTDHLGSSSYITDGQGNVTQTISYLPFGEEQVDLVHFNPAFETTYKFNGKEKDEETGFNYFGARYYYDYLSIWLSVDPKFYLYPHLSSYNYCANNPVNAIDPDGRKIIFVHGYLGGGSPKGGKFYWNNSFINGAKKFFNDTKTYFVNTNYSLLSSAKERQNQGYEWAKQNYATLTKDMEKGEVFNFVSHSMGGAFSKGAEQYLKEQGWEVKNNIMINAFQVDDIENEKNNRTFDVDYMNTDDPILKWFDFNIGEDYLKNYNLKRRENSGEPERKFKHRSPIDKGEKFWQNLRKTIDEAF
jgi:RHS repeat-associated protein